MRFNLKNIPWVICIDRVCDEKDMEKLSKWFEGFEAELREKLPIYDCKGSYSPRAKELIKEILGE